MVDSFITEALHQPVTSVLALVFILIFGLIHHRHIGYAEVGMSYDRIIGDHEWWRCGSSQLSHVELYHLIFNLTALWSIGIAERVMGLGYYLKITALLFILSPLICLVIYYSAIKYAHKEEYRSVTAVGYSCVLFGWMTVLAVKQPGGISTMPLFGATSLPMWMTPFGSLLITSLLVPKASFIGHLSGIFAGYFICLPIFDRLPSWCAGGALVASCAGMAANWGAKWRGGGASGGLSGGGLGLGELKIPLLSKYFGGSGSRGSGGGGDIEGGGRGRVLGTS